MRNAVSIGSRNVPANFGPMKGANAHARFMGPCGDTMEVWLRIVDGRVAQAMFTSDGCQHSILCGSTAAALALGKNQAELLEITQVDVMAQVSKLPDNHQHCAKLAAKTLRKAVLTYWGEDLAAANTQAAPVNGKLPRSN